MTGTTPPPEKLVVLRLVVGVGVRPQHVRLQELLRRVELEPGGRNGGSAREEEATVVRPVG